MRKTGEREMRESWGKKESSSVKEKEEIWGEIEDGESIKAHTANEFVEMRGRV